MSKRQKGVKVSVESDWGAADIAIALARIKMSLGVLPRHRKLKKVESRRVKCTSYSVVGKENSPKSRTLSGALVQLRRSVRLGAAGRRGELQRKRRENAPRRIITVTYCSRSTEYLPAFACVLGPAGRSQGQVNRIGQGKPMVAVWRR